MTCLPIYFVSYSSFQLSKSKKKRYVYAQDVDLTYVNSLYASSSLLPVDARASSQQLFCPFYLCLYQHC